MKYTYIANWKMNLNYHESINYCIDNQEQLEQLSHIANIILCPSFVALTSAINVLKNSTISIGAQNCSEYTSGSYTGEVSAQSLAQIGINYCLVGHSERRTYFAETTTRIIKKINILIDNNITPIICIGENKEHWKNNATLTVISEQLKPIMQNVSKKNTPLLIAYEPLWSIGSGIIPEIDYLEEVFSWIKKIITLHSSTDTTQLLYGGSVTEKNSNQLKKITTIDGFLIGSSSIDFESFATIIKQ